MPDGADTVGAAQGEGQHAGRLGRSPDFGMRAGSRSAAQLEMHPLRRRRWWYDPSVDQAKQKQPLNSWPTALVFRSDDRERYILMHMAKVAAGKYAGWGELEEFTRAEFARVGGDRVIESLRQFPLRNGRNKRKLLRLTGMEPFHETWDQVRVISISPGVLEILPSKRAAGQRRSVALRKPIILVEDVPPEQFFIRMGEAFGDA